MTTDKDTQAPVTLTPADSALLLRALEAYRLQLSDKDSEAARAEYDRAVDATAKLTMTNNNGANAMQTITITTAPKFKGDEPRTHEATLDARGILRWTANNRVPFADMVEAFRAAGHPVDAEACAQAREEDNAAQLASYRAHREANGYSAEERFEMRAAFGAGAVVVDAITGKRVRC